MCDNAVTRVLHLADLTTRLRRNWKSAETANQASYLLCVRSERRGRV